MNERKAKIIKPILKLAALFLACFVVVGAISGYFNPVGKYIGEQIGQIFSPDKKETLPLPQNEPANQASSETAKPANRAPVHNSQINLFEHPEELKIAQAKLAAMFPGETVKFYAKEVQFYPDRIKIRLVSKNKEEIDHYRYEAATQTWHKELPERWKAGSHDFTLDTLEKIDFARVSEVYKLIKTQAKDVPGAKPVERIDYMRDWRRLSERIWTSPVRGSEAAYEFRADYDLKKPTLKNIREGRR